MNIDDIENLGTLPVDQSKLLNELLILAVHNNSLLRVLLSSRAVELSISNPAKTFEEYEKELFDLSAELTTEKYSKILLKLSDNSSKRSS